MIKTPKEIAGAAAEIGYNKGEMVFGGKGKLMRLIALGILAGCFIGIGGALSSIVGNGFTAAASGNPSLPKLLSGIVFPVGLILVVVLGAELFTGNNALLMPAFITKKSSFGKVAANWAIVYITNFIGAVGFAWLFVYICGITSNEPYHSAAMAVAEAKVSMPWHVVLLKGIGANWLVCLAVWLALSANTLWGKVVGCWWPVMTFVVLGYEHCIANMYFIPIGMMEGAKVSIGQLLWNNLTFSTLGNMIGGAIFVGALNAWIHLKK